MTEFQTNDKELDNVFLCGSKKIITSLTQRNVSVDIDSSH